MPVAKELTEKKNTHTHMQAHTPTHNALLILKKLEQPWFSLLRQKNMKYTPLKVTVPSGVASL